MPELVLERLTRRFADHVAVDGIDLRVRDGSFCVLLGPSGCGKSTTLRLIAGLDHASAGRIRIAGRDVTELPPAKRGLAMVFQNYALFPHLSVGENILFGLKVRRVPAAERKARLERAAAILGLGQLLHRKPSQLSGGQQQRVALARAIVAETKLCLMDEPLSNLDAKLRAEMRVEIRALQRRLGMTMIYVTHDQAEALSMADQVVLMRDGRIEQDSTPADLYRHPATTFAASFVGTPPMNLLPLTAVAGGFVVAGTDGPLLPFAGHDGLRLGIRPEALRLAETGFAVTVEGLDYQGADTVLACRLGESVLLARVPGLSAVALGTRLHLAADPPDFAFFDADGRRLEPAPLAVDDTNLRLLKGHA
ncbi:MAG: ABC transporter ATP-binding protein [Geminicoccaceae bacterium]|nr:MAG: ABC transporter ATP-binding protein [Geminicoccaceae bacterium]